jgi:polyhydroxyalkanoate synthesis regulator phasin
MASPRRSTSLAEQLVNVIIKPLGLVMLSREAIQEILEEAVQRGRITRSDANDLASELIQRGRRQTDELLATVRRSDSVDRLVQSADRARRRVGVGPSFPIIGYDDLAAEKVKQRLGSLTPAELRKVRDYERRHADRKSVLAAIEKRLG